MTVTVTVTVTVRRVSQCLAVNSKSCQSIQDRVLLCRLQKILYMCKTCRLFIVGITILHFRIHLTQ
jgi:hypothetical protein